LTIIIASNQGYMVCYNTSVLVLVLKVAAMIIAIANQKGGVGKTTTAVNIGGCLAQAGRRVLLVDMDPQGNAATCLGVAKRSLRYTVSEVLVDDVPAREAIVSTRRPGYDLLPATPDLAGAALTLADLPQRDLRLRKVLAPFNDAYNYVLIDCPPSLGLLTINGLAAAHQVLIPLQCEYLALEGLAQLKQTIDAVREHLNPALHIGGVAMTMYDGRANLARQVVAEVRKFFPNRVFSTLVPRTVRLSEAPSHGELAYEYDPRSRGAQAYAKLTEELLARQEAAR
jgi:chromosome partitioning protein